MKTEAGKSTVEEQVPTWLRAFDDRWGLTWRVVNRIKRTSVRRSWRFHSARFRRLEYDRPIFVLGAPRSGTSAVFRLLGLHPELGSLGREGHDCWRRYHHPRQHGWRSDVVGPGEVRPGEKSFVDRYFHAHFDQARFVEKTPENTVRVPYLLDLFPDAQFVYVKRDPLATISSLINGWRHPLGRYRSYFVPDRLEMPGYRRTYWCFTLIEGWRDYRRSPIPDIAAEQWRQCTRGALAARETVPADRWTEVFLEDLVRDPLPATGRLLDRLSLSHAPSVLDEAHDLAQRPVNAMAEGGPGHWRQNEGEVLSLLPRVRTEIEACGYRVDELIRQSDARVDG